MAVTVGEKDKANQRTPWTGRARCGWQASDTDAAVRGDSPALPWLSPSASERTWCLHCLA